MRNFSLHKWLLAAALLLMPLVAAAAGLGRLAVLSSLGQPLDAEIELLSVRKEDLANLSVQIASPEAYRRANLQYNAVLTGLRVAVRTRTDGKHYIKITSSRPVNEPFVDLLIELNWGTGRLARDYTALIDPPGYAPAVAVAPAPPLPETRSAPASRAPAIAETPSKPIEGGPMAAPGAKEYGPIRRGETLYSIAAGLKPAGVTLEQMIVGLYRANPEAFAKNMNRMRSGKILRVPDGESLKSLSQKEAAGEFRAQVADWNAYRQTIARTAGSAPESGAAASGKITSRVEDKGAGGAKDVVRLSKGEPTSGADGKRANGAEKIRALEEELIAREKALNEANERIAQLNKTLEDLNKKLEIKSQGMATAQQQAETKPETKQPEPAGVPEAKKEGPEAGAKSAAKTSAEPKPAVKPGPKKVVVPPPPPQKPSLMDTVLGEPIYLAAGGGVILLGGLALLMARRRRSRAAEDDDSDRMTPSLIESAPVEPAGEAEAPAPAPSKEPEAAVRATSSEDIDPLDEADVYIAHGRDQQAEAILKEAIVKNPDRVDFQLKLLEVYAARKDRTSFDAAAEKFRNATGGHGADWLRVAAMGYALSPENPSYAAARDLPEAVQSSESVAPTVDFDVGSPATPSSATAGQKPGLVASGTAESGAETTEHEAAGTATPDFTLEVPDADSPTKTDIAREAETEPSHTIDFNIELPKLDLPASSTREESATTPGQQSEKDAGVDFNFDIPNVDLTLDEKQSAGAAAGEEKDAHWYDVQTKFDLVRAYQEIGEKDGAKQLLQEVLEEGDARQQAEAKKLLESLG